MPNSYYFAWLLYFSAAAGISFIYERYITSYFNNPSWKILIRSSLLILMFTPNILSTNDHYLPIPASVSVMFNLLTHSKVDAAIALIPLLVGFFIVFMAMGLWADWQKKYSE